MNSPDDNENKDNNDTQERLMRIETRLAFMEDFMEKLQEEVVERSRVIDRLEAEQKAMSEKLNQLSEELGDYPSRKPPHY